MNTVLFMNALKKHLKKLDTIPTFLMFYYHVMSNYDPIGCCFFFFKYKDIVLQPLISNILKTEALIMLLFFWNNHF